ncbi:zinc and cadmium transporter [Chryseobacterium sp. SORGH_AS909]|uniref:Zinc and cadmium transporter n=1 Tax=Chryseobacterium camelliae TaxID=1265445 RepID=A0ABU0TGS5_9FLAO|nr:zinc and cadmium transporter [Chryseobacterium camelliae]MDQ1099403.1 zinc and cadmium transporter [Chryseobacterium sp. SORGH_AS_1048]MDR6086749.1 zinc and cadmium transporter [Chryseobacterium sp. SORGH_AS_0909]MDR6131121.1 zinc and cadmium transporter [Chryseobacterium sp. SORGH_AS_1175]MDT3406738.1 zinc and cadmium transporter [Pseudacidovorax intermedius]
MITVFLLVMSVIAGILLGKYFGKRQKLAKNLLILSAGFLITVCLNEVFPQVYASGAGGGLGIFVIAGVLLQMILEALTKGFEHGHLHHHSEHNILPVALMVGLFIHAFIEGIPLANERETLSPYLLGIVFHNLPISFILGAFLFNRHGESRSTTSYPSLLIIALFALASPLGMLLGNYFNPDLQPYFLAVVGGIFLHISSVIIFESNKNHNIDWLKIGLVILGVSLALVMHLFHHHAH